MFTKYTEVIAVSGASGIGKTTFCKAIKELCVSMGIGIEHVETDNWILDREARAMTGIHHGYHTKGFYLDQMIRDLDALILSRRDIHVYPYDHSTGKASLVPVTKKAADIIILDGTVSMTDTLFTRYRPLGVFFDAKPPLATRLKHYLNLTEKGYDKAHALSDAVAHEEGYRSFCQPQRGNATWIIELVRYLPRREYRARDLRNGGDMRDGMILSTNGCSWPNDCAALSETANKLMQTLWTGFQVGQ